MLDTSVLPKSTGLDANGRRRLVQVLSSIVVILAIYFIAAGSLQAVWGWVYLGVSGVSVLAGGLYVVRHNPQAINERGRAAEGQKGWDKILLLFYTPLFIIIYIVAGLDFRFNGDSMALWAHLLGALVTLAGSALTYAAMAHNKFLSMWVQVAGERGHQVASSGPYRYVRHPMYLSLVLSWPALALLFGSYWALPPALLASVLIVMRTALEDRTLQTELPGYDAYAREVRWRLIPGVW